MITSLGAKIALDWLLKGLLFCFVVAGIYIVECTRKG